MSEKNLPPGTRAEGVRGEEETARYVREMFARITPRYDLLNRLLSFSLDQVWRRRTAQALGAPLAAADSRALDLCCGTADLTLELRRVSAGAVVGCDFVHPMLVRAAKKAAGRRVGLIEADALKLPFADRSFDAVAVAFGFRNLANYRRGLEEMHRVLKPGGEVAILEFALPQAGLFAALYRFYFRRLLPWIGYAVSGARTPYSYLPASVERFPDCEEFSHWMELAGFTAVSYQLWTGGTVALHQGRKS